MDCQGVEISGQQLGALCLNERRFRKAPWAWGLEISLALVLEGKYWRVRCANALLMLTNRRQVPHMSAALLVAYDFWQSQVAICDSQTAVESWDRLFLHTLSGNPR